MAVIWHDERLTPERMLKVLIDQQQQWRETAEAFDRLKSYLTGTFSLQDAEGNAHACRQRAEQLQAMIDQLHVQCSVDPAMLVKEERRPPYLQ
jgi:hypothetical protein